MAKQPEQPKGKKKRRFSSTLLWGLLGLVILTAGVVSALYYLNRERIQTDTRLKVIKDFVARVDETIGKGKSSLQDTMDRGKLAPGMAGDKMSTLPLAPGAPGALGMTGEGPRTYRVKAGETLWHIAETSKLVDSPWQWRTILIQNRDKIEWAFINQDEQAWKVMLPHGSELSVRPNGQPRVEIGPERKYAMQLASMAERQRGRGEYVVRTLMKDGYYAYLYRTVQNGQTWFRIRSGFYDSEAKARAVGEEIRQRYAQRNLFPDEPWMVRPGAAEVRGEGFEFGAQLVHPWVVELKDRETHAEAVQDLRRAKNLGEFAYIWQSHDALTRRFIYRVRIGFFGTEETAKAMLSEQSGDMWKDARPAKLDTFEETLPGQPTRLAGAKS